MSESLYQRIEIKSISTSGAVEGYASTFGNVDYGRDVVQPGAFAATLKEWSAKKALPPMLWNHDDSAPVGEYLTMAEDKKGLFFTAQLWVEETYAEVRKAVKSLNSTGVKGFSIGGKFAGARDSKGIRAITAVDLYEVSVVPMPMNDRATATSVKSAIDVHAALVDLGFSGDEATRFMSKGYASVDSEIIDSSGEIKDILNSIHRTLKSAR